MAVTCVACLRLLDVRRRPGQPVSRLGENNSSRRESRTGSDRLRLDLWQTNTGSLPLRQSSLPLSKVSAFYFVARLSARAPRRNAALREELEAEVAHLSGGWRGRRTSNSSKIALRETGPPPQQPLSLQLPLSLPLPQKPSALQMLAAIERDARVLVAPLAVAGGRGETPVIALAAAMVARQGCDHDLRQQRRVQPGRRRAQPGQKRGLRRRRRSCGGWRSSSTTRAAPALPRSPTSRR